MRGATARLARLLLGLGLCAAAVACGGGTPEATVTVIIPWLQGQPEYNAFVNVIEPFEAKQRVHVILETTLDVTQQLDADLAAHTVPDVADLPSPAAVNQYETEGRLTPLSGISLSAYGQPWRGLAEENGTAYAIPVKVDVKGLLWYKKGVLPSTPQTLTSLSSLAGNGLRFCLGLASGPTSGWPGDDWLADILLSMSGSSAAGQYEGWLGGAEGLRWTSAPVKAAWEMWGTLLGSGAYIQGGKSGALEDSFSAVLEDHDCLDHGALAATGLPPKALSDYGFTLFPPMSGGTSPLLVSGDFMGQFTPNKNATALLKYLASPSAQSRWVGQSSAFGAYAFSDDQDQAVLGAYPKGVQQDIANLLRPDSHRELCFSAEDMMRPDVSAAFSQAVLDYVNDLGTPDHGAAFLTSLLQGLQTTQQAVGPSPVARKACARS